MRNAILLFFVWGFYCYGDEIAPVTARTLTLSPLNIMRGIFYRVLTKVSQKRYMDVALLLVVNVLVILLVKAYFDFLVPIPLFLGAVISSNGTGGGDADVGASWNGGIAPGAGDDIIVLDGDEITLNGNRTYTDITINNGGILRPSNVGDTLTFANITNNGTLGGGDPPVDWTGTITYGGNWSGTGTYIHGNQLVTNGTGGDGHTMSGTWTFHQLSWTAWGQKYIESSATITVENALTVTTAVLRLKGFTGDTTLNLGTAGASCTVTNNSTIRFGEGGTGDVIVRAVNAGYFANLAGAGVYDWDSGGGDNGVHVKWLNHQGTDATAKTTGGGGVTITQDGANRFYEDFEVATGDTLDANDKNIQFTKTLTFTGTVLNAGAILARNTADEKRIVTVTGTDLIMYGTGVVSFEGTNAFSGALTWNAGTASLLAYDSTSILNVTGGITVPGSTYFCADTDGKMGDGNAVSGWTADQSWGWLNNAGTTTLPRSVLTLTSQTGGDCIVNSGTITHNNCIITPSSSTAHQAISNASNDDLYRVNNQNTYSGTVTFEDDTDLDGIWFTTGTVTEAANGVTVTLTGYTPALGSVGPFTHDLLEASGRLLETGTGTFVFDHELPADTTVYVYRVLRGSTESDQEGVDDVYVKKAENKYDREAKIYIDDYDGGQADEWKYTQGANTYYYGCPVHILYHDGTEWLTLWRGFMASRDSQGTGTGVVIQCFSHDQWLKSRTVDIAFTHRNHTLKEVLQQLIEKYTPVEYVDANIDLSTNPADLQPTFQGETVDEAISSILENSANEEYGVNDDMEFFTRQRATSHDGTNDAPVSFTTNWFDYSFSREGNVHKNRVEVYFGSNLDDMVASDDLTAQTEMQTEMGSAQPIVITMKVSRADLQSATDAQLYADWLLANYVTYWAGTITSYECEDCDPGMITEVTIAEMDELAGTVAFKIEMIEYFMGTDETVLYLQEPAKMPVYLTPLSSFSSVATRAQVLDIQQADSTFSMQSAEWDTEDDFNGVTGPGAWVLGANCQVTGAGAINCSGATVGAEVCTSAWITPGSGKDAVSFWQDINMISSNNDGTCVIYVEGSVTGVVGPVSDWQDIRSSFTKTENVRGRITLEWNGVGTSPELNFYRIRHK